MSHDQDAVEKTKANRGRGMRRLAIAVGVPYFGGWLFYGVASAMKYAHFQKLLDGPLPDDGIELAVWRSSWSDALHGMFASIFWGAVVPALLLLIGGAVFWVYRGFRPKART